MIAATRDKTKMDTLKNSDECATINEDRPIVRQEETQEADINFIIAKYGYAALLGRPQPTYGAMDYTLTLQDHYQAAAEIAGSYEKLPEHVRDRYSREEYLQRLMHGEEIDLTEPKEPPKPEGNTAAETVT